MSGKRKASIILDIGVVVSAALCLYFLYSFMEPGIPRNVLTASILLIAVALAAYEWICSRSVEKNTKPRVSFVSVLTLLSEDNRLIRMWDLSGRMGLVIGKSTEESEVEIDLSDSDYHTYIENTHAILNYHESGWWIFDASEHNGLTVTRDKKELTPGHDAPVKLEPGDVICLANYTRIAVS